MKIFQAILHELNTSTLIEWHKFVVSYHRENDQPAAAPFEKWKEGLLKKLEPTKGIDMWYIEDGDSKNILGVLISDLEQKGQPGEYMDLNIFLLKSLQLESIEASLLEWFDSRKVESLMTVIDIRDPRETYLPEKAGFKNTNQFIYFDLLPRQINSEWLSNSLTKEPKEENYSWRIEREPDDDLLVEMAALTSHGFDSMKRNETGITVKVTAEDLRDSIELGKTTGFRNAFFLLFFDEILVGLSKIKHHTPATIVGQAMTVTLEEFRGKGLASWIKAKFYSLLMEEYPDIEKWKTDCFEINHDMIHINKSMGYKETYRMNEYTYIRKD